MNYRKSNNAVIVECKIFLEVAYSSYGAHEQSSTDGEQLFQNLKLFKSSQLDSTARNVIGKFKAVSSEATQRLQYRAIIKVIWRYIRDKTELVNPERRLFLMILAFSSLTVGARKAMTSSSMTSSAADSRGGDVDKWRNEIASWLGEQLAKYYHHHDNNQAHKLFTSAYLPFFD